MAEIGEKQISRKSALFAGLVQAVALYLVYLSLSLTDLWGYMPPMVQLVVYGGLALAIMMVVWCGLLSKGIWNVKASLKGAFFSVVLLSVAGILAGPDSRRLLEIAVKPRALFDYPLPEIVMTVTPPAYSGRPQFTQYFSLDETPVSGLKRIPEGSEIEIRVTNTAHAPILTVDRERLRILSEKEGGFVAHFTLKDQVSWQIREGNRLVGEWPIFSLSDDAPIIERADFRHLMTGDGLFGLTLDLSDDYGLQEVAVGVVPPGGNTDVLYERTRIAASGLKRFSGEGYINLASSDFAGRRVDLIVEAIDQAGQKQQKILSGITLPAQKFSNPHSRKIIEIRKRIKTEPEIRKKLARELMALGLVPGDGQIPTIYYMALRSAYWRLTRPKDDDDINNARDILWDLAGQLEEGDGGRFKGDILALLASLKLTLYQRQDVARTRQQLQEIDRLVILFLRRQIPSEKGKYDVRELRRIFGQILTHSHEKRFDQAIDLISYLEHGFIYRDRDTLSEQGFKRFQIVSRVREKLGIVRKAQRQIMSFVYRNAVKLEIASLDMKPTDIMDRPKISYHGDIQKWIAVQRKLGASMDGLERILAKSGLNTSQLTAAASDLVGEVLQSMEAGDMESAAGYQGDILMLLDRLKNILDLEIQSRPERP